MTSENLTMYGIHEAQPGPRWRALFEATWPGYRAWYLRAGREARPEPTEAAVALSRHMPELLPVWAKLSEQTGFDQLATTMLTQWDLPAFAPAGCSQVAVAAPEPMLLRNYDYHPELFEGVSISTDYLQPVIGTSDCLWGLLDGMNEAGLTISLTFGGDRCVGTGFAIPLVVRYLLETCRTVPEAWQAVQRLPIAMSYNLTMIDTAGHSGTARVGPDRPAEFRARTLATNHRWDAPTDPGHAARYHSVERLDLLKSMVVDHDDSAQLVTALLRPPLHAVDYRNGFGTLYTAEYRPASGSVTYHWPGTSWRRSFDSPDEQTSVVLAAA